MGRLRLAEDIIPMSQFKARASEWLRRIRTTGQPVVITQNGRPAGVVLSPNEYDALTERAEFLAAVAEGLADAEAGRLVDHADVIAELEQRFGKPSGE